MAENIIDVPNARREEFERAVEAIQDQHELKAELMERDESNAKYKVTSDGWALFWLGVRYNQEREKENAT